MPTVAAMEAVLRITPPPEAKKCGIVANKQLYIPLILTLIMRSKSLSAVVWALPM